MNAGDKNEVDEGAPDADELYKNVKLYWLMQYMRLRPKEEQLLPAFRAAPSAQQDAYTEMLEKVRQMENHMLVDKVHVDAEAGGEAKVASNADELKTMIVKHIVDTYDGKLQHKTPYRIVEQLSNVSYEITTTWLFPEDMLYSVMRKGGSPLKHLYLSQEETVLRVSKYIAQLGKRQRTQ